jgi:hypothetical protein
MLMAEDDATQDRANGRASKQANEPDWLDDLLQADRATPVRNDGFVERLLTELPARRRSRPVWITPLMTCAGTILAVLSLGGPADTLSLLQNTEIAGFIPLGVLLAFGVLLVSCLWAVDRLSADTGIAPRGPTSPGDRVGPGTEEAGRYQVQDSPYRNA